MTIAGTTVASIPGRVLSAVVDHVVLLGPVLVLVLVAAPPAGGAPQVPALVGAAVWAVGVTLAQWIGHARTGQTAGRRLFGLRTLDATTGEPLGMLRVLMRALVMVAGLAILGVGLIAVQVSPLLDRSGRRRGWHDRAVGAEVLDVRAGIDPTRTPRTRAAGSSWAHSAPLVSAAPEPRPSRPRPTSPDPSGPGPSSPDPSGPDLSGPDSSGPESSGVDLPRSRTSRVDDSHLAPPRPPAPAAPPAAPPVVPLVVPSGVIDAPIIRHVPGFAAETAATAAVASVAAPEPPRAEPPVRTPRSAPGTEPLAPALENAPVPEAVPVLVSASEEPAPSFPAELEDDLELTRVRTLAAPRTPGPATPSVTIGLSDARRFTVRGTALVGRRPLAGPGEPVAQLVSVQDPGLSVSKTHLGVGVDAGGAWVSDRGSTNGTMVTLPDGQQIACVPGRRVKVSVGARVSFGDFSLVVLAIEGLSSGEPGAPAPASSTVTPPTATPATGARSAGGMVTGVPATGLPSPAHPHHDTLSPRPA